MIYLILFFVQIIILFFITKKVTAAVFWAFRKIFRNEKLVLSLVSVIYLPGTIVHEVSHMLAAMLLMLKVVSIRIFPVFEEGRIQLGAVTFEKKDFVRGFLVGIAPILVGILCLFLIFSAKLFPAGNLFQNIFFVYIIFALSSTMFSSKQDLVDFIYFIPFLIIVGLLIYILQVDIRFVIKNQQFAENVIKFFKDINLYLFFSLIINITLFLILRIVNKTLRR